MTTPVPAEPTLYDVVVIGGGAAGLAGAVALARSRRSVLVVDAGSPRNARAEGVHVLLALDGIAPAELLRRGREEVTTYGGRVTEDEVVAAARDDDGLFLLGLRSGDQVRARRLLVATGGVDTLPEIPGLAEHWGHAVVHCPYCHGWEVRDRAIGVIATHPMFAHQALLFRQLSDDVVVFLHGDLAPEQEHLAQLRARGVEIVDERIAALTADGATLTGVRLESGRVVPREVLTVQSRLVARLGALEALGLSTVEGMMGVSVPTTDIGGRSAVPGVWVAGNVTEPGAQVGASAAAGVMAGAQINADLAMAEAAAALAAVPAG